MLNKVSKAIKLVLNQEFREEWLERRRLSRSARYVPTTTQFKGAEIKLLDAPSFVFQKQEIFDQGTYRFVAENGNPRIIDAGANIGVSIMYFKHLYPQAQITAFEADPKIYEVLNHNLGALGHGDVEVVNKALWSSVTELEFNAEGTDGGHVSTNQREGETVKVQTTLLSEYLNEPVDFLKIDIEGAEYQVLQEAAGKLSNVKNMFVEYHSFVGQEQNLHQILQILADAGFRYYITYIGINQQSAFTKVNANAVGHDMQLNISAIRK